MNRDWIIFGFLWSFLFGVAFFLLTRLWYTEQHIIAIQEQQTLEAQSCNMLPVQEN